MKAKSKGSTRGERVIKFIETYCHAPEGKLVGQLLVLQPFQKKFLLEVYDRPGVHTAVLSIGRKNGKTALIAAILLAHLAGPEAVQNSQIVSGAMSREQAALVHALATKMVNMSPELSARVRVFPSGKRLLGLVKNVEYRALAADGRTAHGLSPVLAILDELGQVRGPTDPFVEAIETAQGAYDNPLKIIISTQAPTDLDMLSQIIDAPEDPRVIRHVYRAADDAELDDPKAWAASNPALGVFRSLEDVKKQCEKAMAIPSFEPAYRNLILNMRCEAVAPFVPKSVWQANGGDPGEPGKLQVWGGLDLSEVHDLTSLMLVDESGGVHSTFWLPAEGLAEKARKDKAPYDLWAKQGHLKTTPGKTIQYRFVAGYLREVFDKYNIQAIGFDRYHMQHLKEWLEKAGFSDSEMAKFHEFGQGTASMTPALREFEVKLFEGQLRHGNQPCLAMCAANARVIGDSGARKFDKKTARGRIDGMVALAMAIGTMPQKTEDEGGTLDDYLNSAVAA